MATQTQTINSPVYGKQLRRFTGVASVTLITTFIAFLFLLPFAYGFVTAFKDKEQIIAGANGPILPMDPVLFEYEGAEYELFTVPMPDGSIRELAMVDKGRRESTFIDPANPADGEIVWEGRWRELDQVLEFSPRMGNFEEAWTGINFPRLFRNTLAIAVLGLVGTLISSICVAYGFARFPIPGKQILFLLLISTIALPTQVT